MGREPNVGRATAPESGGRRLYELAGADLQRIFSPYCWRIRMALAHKGLSFESVPWRFTEKEAIGFSGQGKVPVLCDRGRTVVDSWTIAEYLDQTYPIGAPLFGSAEAKGVSRFVADWTEAVVHPALVQLIILDIFEHLAPVDREYFRASRERLFGRTLEEIAADPEAKLSAFRKSLEPARRTLGRQSYLAGPEPAFVDYVLFGAFQWARAVSPKTLLSDDDPVAEWRRRLLGSFDGMPAAALGYPT